MSSTLPRVKRYLIWAAISMLLLVMLLLAAISTFLATETGSRYLVQQGIRQVDKFADMQVSVAAIRGNLLQGLQLDSLDLNTPAIRIEVSRVNASWDPFSLFSGTLQLAVLDLQQATLTLPVAESDADSAATNPLAGFSFPPLPVNIELGRLVVADLNIDSAGQALTIQSLAAQVRLQGNTLELSDLALTADALSLDGDVDLTLASGLPLAAQVDWRYQQALPLELGSADGELRLSGRIDSLNIDSTINTPFQIRSAGSIEPFAAQGLTLNLQHRSPLVEFTTGSDTWRFTEVRLATQGVPSALRLGLDSTASGSLIPELTLTADGELSGPVLTIGQARAETGHGVMTASLSMDWSSGFRLSGNYQLEDADPELLLQRELPVNLSSLSSTGNLNLVNSAQGQTIELRLERATATLDQYPLTASGDLLVQDGDIRIDNLLLESEANQLSVSGSYADNAEADLRWQLQAPVLEQFVPSVSAMAQGSGYLRGSLSEPQIEASIDITNLVSEFGRVAGIQLQVSGDPAGYEGEIQVNSADLADQSLTVSTANLNFGGTRAAHQAGLQLNSDRGTAELRFAGGFRGDTGIDWSGRIETARLLGDAGHWRLVSPVDLDFQDSLVSVDNSCWSYQQVQACVSLLPAENGQQRLEATVNRFPLQEFNSLREREPLFNLDQIPRLPDDVSLSGSAAGSITASFGAGLEPQLDASLSADDTVLLLRSIASDVFGAEVSEAEVLEQQYRWRRLSLRAILDQGSWDITSRAQLHAENVQESSLGLDGNLEASLGIDRNGNLSGRGTAEFADLGWITAFVPELRNVSGELDSTVSFSGTLQQPKIAGDLAINRGGFLVDRSGVSYSDFELQLSSDSAGNATLEGSVGSGEGFVSFTGEARAINSENWRVSADLQGEEFPLAYLPDLVVEVSPELNLNADPSQISLQGRLEVPLLDLTLRELPESAVDISRDVVIVDYPEDRPELGMTFTTGQMAVMDTPVSADVQIVLGQEVTLRGFGLEAGLAGSLEIEQEADGTNLTYGELEVTEGRYSIYGQTLTLQNGKLLFLGNYNNPAIDIRAVRQVDDLTVGVLMSGTLNNISSELFSTPTLPQSDILAVLVTGRQFSDMQQSSADGEAMIGAIAQLGIKQSQGLTEEIGDRFGLDTIAITNTGDIDSSTLTIGKYLTPKVFVRYGVGLFDSFSKLAVDYMINDRLTLQAESGERQSIDFTYRVER